jgi:hypothetical protein
MTIEVKRKILWWVKRVLNYCEYADRYPYIVVEHRKLIKIRSEHHYPNRELLMVSEDQIHYAANMQLMDELEKNKLIRYSQIQEGDSTRVVAELNVILL